MRGDMITTPCCNSSLSRVNRYGQRQRMQLCWASCFQGPCAGFGKAPTPTRSHSRTSEPWGCQCCSHGPRRLSQLCHCCSKWQRGWGRAPEASPASPLLVFAPGQAEIIHGWGRALELSPHIAATSSSASADVIVTLLQRRQLCPLATSLCRLVWASLRRLPTLDSGEPIYVLLQRMPGVDNWTGKRC